MADVVGEPVDERYLPDKRADGWTTTTAQQVLLTVEPAYEGDTDVNVWLWTRKAGESHSALLGRSAVISLVTELVRRAGWLSAMERPYIGCVDGAVLAELIAEQAPGEWTTTAAQAMAERVLAEAAKHGLTVLRGPNSVPWHPDDTALHTFLRESTGTPYQFGGDGALSTEECAENIPADMPAAAALEEEPRCPAHGNAKCALCSRNPFPCSKPYLGCAYYEQTGMHWDTCQYRDRATPPSAPEGDPIGTVREAPVWKNTAVKIGPARGCNGWAVIDSFDWLRDEEVTDWPVIGSVPGTPAAGQRSVASTQDGEQSVPSDEREALDQIADAFGKTAGFAPEATVALVLGALSVKADQRAALDAIGEAFGVPVRTPDAIAIKVRTRIGEYLNLLRALEQASSNMDVCSRDLQDFRQYAVTALNAVSEPRPGGSRS